MTVHEWPRIRNPSKTKSNLGLSKKTFVDIKNKKVKNQKVERLEIEFGELPNFQTIPSLYFISGHNNRFNPRRRKTLRFV